MATRTGLEPVASSVTGLRDNQLHQRAIFCSYRSLIRVHLGFERLRVYSLIRSQLSGAANGSRTHTLLRAQAPQACLSTNSNIAAYMWLIYVLMESPTTAGYLLSVVAWTNTLLTWGHGKFYFAFLYLDRRFPQATYYLSMPVYEKLQHIEIPVVVETYKIRVNASMVPIKGLEPLRRRHENLNLACLPIPPNRHNRRFKVYTPTTYNKNYGSVPKQRIILYYCHGLYLRETHG